MKIAMIGHKDFPSRSGGVEVVVYELAIRLAARGHDITVYNRGLEKHHNIYESNGVTVRRIPTFKSEKLNAMVYSFLATFDALIRGFDVIHYHAIGPSVPLIIARLFGKKTVATVHGLNWRCDKWGGFASAYLKLGEKIVAKFAHEIIVLSEETQLYFKQTYGRKATIIKNGVDFVNPLPANLITSAFGLKKDDYILYIGRISPEKGPQDLIEGFKQSKTDKKLVIVGEIPDNAFGAEIKAQASGCESIICAGFRQGDILSELYANCALYVLPSHTEGLALTLLEAMSCGAKCLVSNIPENVLVTKHFGFEFVAENTASLAAEIDNALSTIRTDEQKQEQISYVRATYDYNAVIDRHETVYRSVLPKKRFSSESMTKYVLSSIQNKNIILHLQPIVDTDTETVCGCEILSRIYHPDLGLLMPDEFLDIVNSNGIYAEFDYLVFEKCCEWAHERIKNGMSGKIVTCNFSRRTAAMPDFAEKVIEIANANGVSSSAVAIELVEYDIADDTEQVVKNLDILHEKGFRILLDDWGAGYTSYSDICNLPIDILKMDRSILNNACTEKGRIVFENIVQLGNMLKIPVLCEGIETEEQAYIAGHYGCKISQGFYHYLPAPPEKYNSLME